MKMKYQRRAGRAFTLVELIIVVIIVGILASLGLTQYSLVVEKSRLAEAKVRIGVMRNLAYEYYLNNGVMTSIQYADLDVDNSCSSTSFYRYRGASYSVDYVSLVAERCGSGGKTPNAARVYKIVQDYSPKTGASGWYCQWTDNSSACPEFVH